MSITSKRIKLQMWDCAQKKALEKIFNLVTDKSCLKGNKGAKMSYRKTCVFFNSGSRLIVAKVSYDQRYPIPLSWFIWCCDGEGAVALERQITYDSTQDNSLS